MTSHPRQELEARLALAEKIAREAGAKALDYFKQRETLVIETKRDPQDVVSIADRDVEQLIRARVSEAFSQDGFLGEEYGLNEGTSGYTWVVDPIDGTSPFVNGMPNWCVSIAVLKDGEPVIGVIQALDQLERFQIKRTKCGFRCRERSGYVRLALCVDHFFCLSVGAAFHETMMQLSVLFYAVYCFSPCLERNLGEMHKIRLKSQP